MLGRCSRRSVHLGVLFAAVLAYGGTVAAQLGSPFSMARLHPAIDYTNRPTHDAVSELARRVSAGEVTLRFEPGEHGYLRSVLDALQVVPDSQVLVFSKTSFQASRIGPDNPRALYFNDRVSVGWIRGGDYMEFAAVDPEQGAVFYTLRQSAEGAPQFERNASCLSCHVAENTRDVPGMFAGSIYPNPAGNPLYAPVYYTDHRSPLQQRWGGWYVTGRTGASPHMGNGVVADPTRLESISAAANRNLTTLDTRVNLSGYIAPGSDVVALMVLEHQMHLQNLLTRAAWEYRIAAAGESGAALAQDAPRREVMIEATRPRAGMIAALRARPLPEVAVEVLDYMLFVDEPLLAAPIEGSSGFAQQFAALGPRDARGRSLRQLDLSTRLLRYPLSYLIYSAQFEALPAPVKRAIYDRLGVVLSGQDPAPIYRRLSVDDRRAIVEILRETKADLPEGFAAALR